MPDGVPMKLRSYLEQEKIKPAEFAARCAVPISTITRLLAGKRKPGIDLMTAIHRASAGVVTPNDFLPDDDGAGQGVSVALRAEVEGQA